jgi:catechol 2,3-dioxygenase-like lactoylglutathione lyase family enzyme
MTNTANKTDSVVTIIGLHHAGIPVNNLERSVEFYTQILGMELKGVNRSETTQGHFTGANLPKELDNRNVQGEADYQEYAGWHKQARGSEPPTNFARMRAGNMDVVLFERPDPAEGDTLIGNGIFHQSFHVSNNDFERLLQMKASGDARIRIHTGPVLRWPHGRALYIWDSEGNYLELETEEDLPVKYGIDR